MLLCVASNGLGVPPHAEALGKLPVSHVTLTVNAVDPQIGAKVYAWIRDGKKVYRGLAGGRVALEPPGRGDPHAQAARRGRQDQHDHHPRRERRSCGRGRPAGRRLGGRHCQLRAAVSRARHALRRVGDACRRSRGGHSRRRGPASADHVALHPLPRRCRRACWARPSGRRWRLPCCKRRAARSIRPRIGPTSPWPRWKACS